MVKPTPTPVPEPSAASQGVRACVGLGANLGDARGTVEAALAALAAAPHTRLVARSALYRSAPVDAQGPDFVNAVAVVHTALSAPACLQWLQSLENLHGRARPYRNAPRTLDLDLLLWDELVLDSPALQLPHPRMHQRAFVLVPLSELLPDLHIPGRGLLRALLADVGDQAIERIAPQPD